MAERGRKLVKEKTHKQLIKELDKVYSIYIRSENAVDNVAECYTCGKKENWKYMDCGHYISRKVKSTRWYKKNTKPQCKRCNVFMEGNKPTFALKLKKEYGSGILEELDQLSHIIVKYSKEKLQSLIFYYKRKIK